MEETGPLGPPAVNKPAKAKKAKKIVPVTEPVDKDLAEMLAAAEQDEQGTVSAAAEVEASVEDEPAEVPATEPEAVEEPVAETVPEEPKPVEIPAEKPKPTEPAPEPVAETPSQPSEETMAEETDTLNDYWHDPGDPDGVIAKEQEELDSQRRKNREAVAANKREPEQRYKSDHTKLWAIPVLLLLFCLPVAAFWYTAKKNQTASVHKTSTTAASKQAPAAATTTPTSPAKTPTETTKNYNSTTYTLGFDYPESWKVSDTAARLTVTSPSLPVVASDGSKTAGHVQVTIQNQQSTIAGFPSDGAIATLASQRLVYKQPTTIQRGQTYLSFLGYKASALDGLYITGDDGYQAQQAVPMADIIKHNPLISVTFVGCANDDCSSGSVTPLSLQASSWQAASFSSQVINLIESLQLD